jgi:flagella basal body P-ring formation protein FlgA
MDDAFARAVGPAVKRNNAMKHLLLITLLLLPGIASAAEIELLPHASPSGAVVKLGDVATIHGAGSDAAALQAIELVPAPTKGRSRTLKSRDVQDLVALQGVKIVEHQFTGASSVQIGGTMPVTTASFQTTVAPSVKATRSAREQLAARVERAIQRHLAQQADDRIAWQIEVELTNEQINSLASRSGEIIATGGAEPWTGEQSFLLQVATPKGVVRIPATAIVSLPEMVVVPKRPFRRGEVLHASDLELKMPSENEDATALVTRVEDAIGRETTRSLATGQPIEAGHLRKPTLVRRGEIVTVFAHAANLVVRTQARALQDGGEDDIVSVERLDNRQAFTARVVGVQELEVLVGGTKVTSKR